MRALKDFCQRILPDFAVQVSTRTKWPSRPGLRSTRRTRCSRSQDPAVDNNRNGTPRSRAAADFQTRRSLLSHAVGSLVASDLPVQSPRNATGWLDTSFVGQHGNQSECRCTKRQGNPYDLSPLQMVSEIRRTSDYGKRAGLCNFTTLVRPCDRPRGERFWGGAEGVTEVAAPKLGDQKQPYRKASSCNL